MATKKPTNKAASNTIVLDLNDEQTELLASVPWFNERYLLPGESVSDYDIDLQRLVESIDVKDPLDAILVKEIHDELREVQRMRALRQAILLRGMSHDLSNSLTNSYSRQDDLRVTMAVAEWQASPGKEPKALLILLSEAGITMERLLADAYKTETKQLQRLEVQVARHEKNVRETLKMIDIRRNHKLMRQRIEFDLEQDRQKLIADQSDGD